MKKLTGYLIDRATGLGVSGKAIAFQNLAGAAITTATTYAQSTPATTDANGKFAAWFELSPGPVNVRITAAASEYKVRKYDESAQISSVWMSDIGMMGLMLRNGVIDGYLNELSVSCPAGHTIRIATGAAMINGNVFSIENGVLDTTGSANTNPAIDPRLDLVTLRQYKESASGQDSGRQAVVITLGTSSGVAPATPTGADFTDLPLAVVSTAYNAATKTVSSDLRDFGNRRPAPKNAVAYAGGSLLLTTAYQTYFTVEITGLDASKVYDGRIDVRCLLQALMTDKGDEDVLVKLNHSAFGTGVNNEFIWDSIYVAREGDTATTGHDVARFGNFSWPFYGFTGSATLTVPIQFKRLNLVTTGSITMYQPSFAHLSVQER